ncbi:phage tail tape measure protein, partial [Bifidobacterium imperatoris]
AAVTTFAQFDAAMSTVQANTGASAAELDKLRQAAIDAGANTVYNAQEAADAINELGKAGMSTTDILSGGLSGALNLAASDGMQVSEAAELMSSAMAQFNLTGKQAGNVADALAAGAGKAQGSARDLGYALQQSGMVANSFGIGMTETVGTLTAFANAGMIGSDAGTSLKTMLISLANPSTKAKNLMQELGINAYDAQGNFIGLANLAGQLQDKMGGLTQEQRNQALATIFGSDAIRAANVLYNEGAKGIDKWTKKVEDSGFAAQQAAAKNDNLKGDLENLSGSFESMLITIGSGANGPLRSLVQTLDTVVDAFSSLPAPVQQGTVLLGAAGGAVAALHKQFGPLAESSSATSQKLGLLIDPIQRLTTAGPQLKDGFVMLGGVFKTTFESLSSGTPVIGTSTAAMSGLKNIGSGVVDLLGGPWGIAMTAAGAAIGYFANKAAVAKQETQNLSNAMESGQDAATALANAIIKGDWGSDLGFLNSSKDVKNLNDALKACGVSAATFSQAAAGNKQALKEVNQALKEHEEANDRWVHGINVGKAQSDLIRDSLQKASDQIGANKEQTKELADANEQLGESGTEAADGLNQTANAADDAADAASILANNFGATTDGINEQAAALGEVTDALSTYYGFSTSASDALISMHDAFDKATKAAQENGQTLDLNTEKGRSNQSALNDIADSALKAAEAQAKNGSSMDEINGT